MVNAESMEFCSLRSETEFISEQLCGKLVEVVAAAEERQDQIYSKGTLSKIVLSRYISILKNRTSICNLA